MRRLTISPVGTVDGHSVRSSLQDLGRQVTVGHPALKRGAMLKCPCGADQFATNDGLAVGRGFRRRLLTAPAWRGHALHDMNGYVRTWIATLPIFVLLACSGCSPSEPNALEQMPTDTVRIKDHAFQAWIAAGAEEVERGLMYVTKEEMAPLEDGTERGMLFVFGYERSTGFWMRNTIIPLDIAFIREDGVIVTIHTMAPFDERSYLPSEPYRYALEVNANVFAGLGIRAGDQVQIPESVLKRSQ